VNKNDRIEMADVTVDVIIDRRVAYGTVGSTPFRARLGNTSPYLGGGKSIWEVNDEFSTVQKRIIARAIWKEMANEDDSAVKLHKEWRVKDNWGFGYAKRVDVELPGRKMPKKLTLYKGKK
jgi:hypothetical protein